MNEKILQEIGFEKNESKIYLLLLKLGPSPASKVGSELGLDRTTSYYTLIRMLEKGFVTQIIAKNTKTFGATAPKHLLALIEERKARFADIVPELHKLQTTTEPFLVEVRQGNEGLRYLYRDAIKTGKEIMGLGIDDAQYIEADKTGLEQYYRDAEKNGIKEKMITYKGAKMFGSKISAYRYVDKKYFQPTPTITYGNTIVMMTWKPTLHLIFINSKELADAYKKNFMILWKSAKKNP